MLHIVGDYIIAEAITPPPSASGLQLPCSEYGRQYVPLPRQRARRSPVCCRGNGMRLRQLPRPRRQRSE